MLTHQVVDTGHVVFIEILQQIIALTVQPLRISTALRTVVLRSFFEEDGVFPKCAILVVQLTGYVLDHYCALVGHVQFNSVVKLLQEAWRGAVVNRCENSNLLERIPRAIEGGGYIRVGVVLSYGLLCLGMCVF